MPVVCIGKSGRNNFAPKAAAPNLPDLKYSPICCVGLNEVVFAATKFACWWGETTAIRSSSGLPVLQERDRVPQTKLEVTDVPGVPTEKNTDL